MQFIIICVFCFRFTSLGIGEMSVLHDPFRSPAWLDRGTFERVHEAVQTRHTLIENTSTLITPAQIYSKKIQIFYSTRCLKSIGTILVKHMGWSIFQKTGADRFKKKIITWLLLQNGNSGIPLNDARFLG